MTEHNKHWQQDKNHFIHPYTDFSSFKDEGSQVISRASGMYITDSDGKQYLDGIAGLWCVNIGHGREELANVAAEQIRKMDYFNPFGHSTNEPASELAAKLASLAPDNINHVFYGCGGSVANDTAVRLVHHYFNQRKMPSKKMIISRLDGYHGSTYLAASLTGIQGTKIEFDTLQNGMVHHLSAANMYRKPEHMTEQDYCDYLVAEFEQRILQLGADNVGAFIAEPIMGAGGVLVAPNGYHKAMYEVCKKYDLLYIADEVVTAFGRLGHMMASEKIYGMTPDIICIAKGLTSGYQPLGATLISDEIYAEISKPQCEGGLLTHGFTYSGHPVACAVALKNIEIMEQEHLCDHVKAFGPKFYDMAQALKENDIVGDVRGSHLMIGIEIVKDKETKENFDITLGLTHKIFEICRDAGVIVRPVGHLIVLSPPLIINEPQAQQIFAALDTAIKTVQNEIAR